MKDIEQIKKRLESLKPVLEKDFHVVTIGVFGSYCRGEQTKKSDVDILVEFSQDAHIGLFKYVELELFLSDRLGVKVDLVMKNGLKPSLKDQILNEIVGRMTKHNEHLTQPDSNPKIKRTSLSALKYNNN